MFSDDIALGWTIALPIIWNYVLPSMLIFGNPIFGNPIVVYYVVPIVVALLVFFLTQQSANKKGEWSGTAAVHVTAMLSVPVFRILFILFHNDGTSSYFDDLGFVIFFIFPISIVFTFIVAPLLLNAVNKSIKKKKDAIAAAERERLDEEQRRIYEQAQREYEVQAKQIEEQKRLDEEKSRKARIEIQRQIEKRIEEINNQIIVDRNKAEQIMTQSPLVKTIANCIFPFFQDLIDQSDRKSHMKVLVRLTLIVQEDTIEYYSATMPGKMNTFSFAEEGIAEKLVPIKREALCKALTTELRFLILEKYPIDANGQKVQVALEHDVELVSSCSKIPDQINTYPEYDNNSYATAVILYQTFDEKGEKYF